MHELVGPGGAPRRCCRGRSEGVSRRRGRDAAPRAPGRDRNHRPDARAVGRRMIRRVAASFLAVIAFLPASSTPAQAASAPPQYRALWVDAFHDGMKSPAQRDKLFVDLARSDDSDGLHLDFIRYPGQTWGYSPTAIALYMLQSGASRTPTPTDPRWEAWRRARVTAFVRDLNHELKQEKPSLKLSGALICFGGGPVDPSGWSLTSPCSP